MQNCLIGTIYNPHLTIVLYIIFNPMSSTDSITKDREPGFQRIQLTTPHRIGMISCFFIQIVLFVYFQALIAHYVFLPMPALFSAPSLLSSPYIKPHYIYNAILYALFFVQHVVMALIKFKVSLQSISPSYPLYQRYIYNITSSIAYIAIVYNLKPISDQSSIIFTTPFLLHVPFIAIAVIGLSVSVVRLGGDIFSPYSLAKILNHQYIDISSYTKSHEKGLVSTGIYKYCRHPMQASVILLFLFASNVYTTDRFVFIAVNLIGIFVGVYYEQKRLTIKFKNYQEYQKKVPYKFIPFVV